MPRTVCKQIIIIIFAYKAYNIHKIIDRNISQQKKSKEGIDIEAGQQSSYGMRYHERCL